MLLFAIFISFDVLFSRGYQNNRRNKQSNDVNEKRFTEWALNYTAPLAKHQNFCYNIINHKNGSVSQHEQDLFVFFNLFKYWPMNGKIGTYVDSGANEAKLGSNTYFFDVCLGWTGLCIEPDKTYHANIKIDRSCTLIEECISDSNKTISMTNAKNGAFMKVGSSPRADQLAMNCDSLKNMMDRVNMQRVDFWSLDVEGHEMTVLQSVDFSITSVSVMLVEDYFISTRNLDRLLSENGYNKYHQLAVDTVHVKRNHKYVNEVWYPQSYHKNWKETQRWRDGADKKLLIC